MIEQNKNIRPTKKQQELLAFIEQFIGEHGYSPSYREIMTGCNYTSVATVSLHVNNLIKRGHLVKRDHNARSIEVVKNTIASTELLAKNDENWVVEKVRQYFTDAEKPELSEAAVSVDQLQTLVDALQLLGMQDVASEFDAKLTELSQTVLEPEVA